MTLRRLVLPLGLSLMLIFAALPSSIFADDQGAFGIVLSVNFLSVDLENRQGIPHPGWFIGFADTNRMYAMTDSDGVYIHNQSNVLIDVGVSVQDIGPEVVSEGYVSWLAVDSVIDIATYQLEMVWTAIPVASTDWSSRLNIVETYRPTSSTWPPAFSPYAYLRFHSRVMSWDSYTHRLQVTWVFSQH